MPAADSPGQPIVWMRREREPRGQHPRLTRDAIAAAGIALADAEGLAALSMRKVAAELGCGTMSLYRHVSSKDELLDIMIDAGIGETAGPQTERSGDWRQDLRRIACGMRAALLRHPWAAQVIGRRPALGPNMLAATESTLSAVDGLGLSIDQMLRAIGLVNAFVVGFVISELNERAWRYPHADRSGPAHPWGSAMIPYVQSIIESGEYPLMTRLVIEAEDFPDPEEVFGWQLDRVLDGLAAIIPDPQPDSG